MDPSLILLAHSIAAENGLEPALVCAVVEQESSWNPFAIRYEPAFRSRYVAALQLTPTEEIARSMSWGLMQVMGQVAREHGFHEKSLAALCDPANGIGIGCKVLSSKILAANGDVVRGLQLWNGGANPSYAEQVLAKASKHVASSADTTLPQP